MCLINTLPMFSDNMRFTSPAEGFHENEHKTMKMKMNPSGRHYFIALILLKLMVYKSL